MQAYLWTKTAHLVFVFAFVAAAFYLPRLLVNLAEAGDVPAVRERGAWAIYVVITISGATALSAEVIWTRILSLLYGGTVYTFSLILAVFLLGLGLGSSVGSALSRTIPRPRLALAWAR